MRKKAARKARMYGKPFPSSMQDAIACLDMVGDLLREILPPKKKGRKKP